MEPLPAPRPPPPCALAPPQGEAPAGKGTRRCAGLGGSRSLLLKAFQPPPRRPEGSRQGSRRRPSSSPAGERKIELGNRRCGWRSSQHPGHGLGGPPGRCCRPRSLCLLPPEERSAGRLSRAPARPRRTSHAPDAAASGLSCSPAGRLPNFGPGGSQRRPLPSTLSRAGPGQSPREPPTLRRAFPRRALRRQHRLRPVEVAPPAAAAPAGARRTHRAWPARPRLPPRLPLPPGERGPASRPALRRDGRTGGWMDGRAGRQRTGSARSPGTPAGRVRRQWEAHAPSTPLIAAVPVRRPWGERETAERTGEEVWKVLGMLGFLLPSSLPFRALPKDAL